MLTNFQLLIGFAVISISAIAAYWLREWWRNVAMRNKIKQQNFYRLNDQMFHGYERT